MIYIQYLVLANTIGMSGKPQENSLLSRYTGKVITSTGFSEKCPPAPFVDFQFFRRSLAVLCPTQRSSSERERTLELALLQYVFSYYFENACADRGKMGKTEENPPCCQGNCLPGPGPQGRGWQVWICKMRSATSHTLDTVQGTVSNRTPVANRNGLNIHFLSWYFD